MFIELGDGSQVSKKDKKDQLTIYQAQDKYPDPATGPPKMNVQAEEDMYYWYGQNGKKNP
jgi:hypothetical protein